VPDCGYVAEGKDEAELVHNFMEHMKGKHGTVLDKMTPAQKGHIIHKVHHTLHIDNRRKNLW